MTTLTEQQSQPYESDLPLSVPANYECKEMTAEESGIRPEEGEIPEGGLQAWLVVAGVAGSAFCTMGFGNTFGIFQEYYSLHKLPHQNADQIAWIGSIQNWLVLAAGALSGPLADRLGSWIIRPACVTYIFALMMLSICKEYWQIMLAQGILAGFAMPFIMFPGMAVLPQWFKKRLGAAMGLAIAGSSLGGVLFPIILDNLFYKTDLGFGWSIRICAFVMVPILGLTCITVRSRLPPRKTAFFLPEAFHNSTYLTLIASLFFMFIAMLSPLIFIPTFAIKNGMNETLASYLVAVVNSASIFGRVIPGVLGDRLGRVNVLVGSALSTAILVFCWPKATSNAGIIVFSVIFGFCSGTIISGGGVALTTCADKPTHAGTYIGVGMSLASFSFLIGPPVTGAMVDTYHSFDQISWFGGSTALVGACLAVLAKYLSKGGLWSKL